MNIAVASTSQYVFKRNFNQNKWQNISKGQCKVQVFVKGDEFYFKLVFRDDEDKSERIEHHLPQDTKLHLSKENGFVQVPIADTKELYGIKFTNSMDGETFYGKVVKELGQQWCDQRTMIGPDDLPNPYHTFDHGGGGGGGGARNVANTRPLMTLPAKSRHSPEIHRKNTYDGDARGGGMHNMRAGGVMEPPLPLRAGGVMEPPLRAGGVMEPQLRAVMDPPLPLRAGGVMEPPLPLRAGGVMEPPLKTGGVMDPQLRAGGGMDRSLRASGSGQPARAGGYYNDPRQSDHPRPGSGGGNYDGYQRHGGGGDYSRNTGGGGGGGGNYLRNDDGGRGNAGGGGGAGGGGNYDEYGYPRSTGGDGGGGGGGNFDEYEYQRNTGGGGGGGGGGNFDEYEYSRRGGGGGGGGRGGRGGRGGGGGGDYRYPRSGGGGGGVGGDNDYDGRIYANRPPERYDDNIGIGGEGGGGGGGGGGGRVPARRDAWPENENRRGGPQPRPAARAPIPLKEGDLSGVLRLLTGAINSKDKQKASKCLDALLTFGGNHGSISLDVGNQEKENKREQREFVLSVKVEFQQPHKEPLSIFLEAHESDTIDILQTQVQLQFFIPKASQNWIIGENLITSKEDKQKTLRDFGISHDVKVYMYVMHTKKANVSKEEYELIRSRQIQQKKQQQGGGGGGGGGERGGQENQGEPVYDTINKNGFNGRGQYEDQSRPPRRDPNPPRQPAYPQEQSESAYQHINNQSRGRGEFITRNALPSRNSPDQYFDPREGRGFDPQVPRNQHHQGGGNPNPRPHPEQLQAPPPPPSRAVVKEVKKVGWECQCTWNNPPLRPSCEMCARDRPEDYVVPEDVPIDDITRQAQENDRLFQEYNRKEEETKMKNAEENYRQYLAADDREAVTNMEEFDCIICYTPVEPGEGIKLRGCLHDFCKDCLKHTVTNSPDPEVKCPFDNGEYVCGAVISEREIKAVVTDEELEKLFKKGLSQAENAAANSFHCKSTDCEGFCFYEDEVNEFVCPICTKKNCLLCKAIHEDMNCQEYQDDLKRRSDNDEAAKETQKMLEDLVEKGDAMYCPTCKVIVQKKDGCDWIRCIMCKTEICWATKGPRWGPKGRGDTTGGCQCRVGGKKCTPLCRNCH